MSYRALDKATLADYLSTVPELHGHLTDFRNLEIDEVGDGNLNFVYIVRQRDAPSRSVVVKQAVPYLRIVGESWPLTRHRMDSEVAALRRFGALCPAHVPAVYHASSEMSLVVMRHLSTHRILRQGLMAGTRYPHLADHLSTFMARVLFSTSDLAMTAEDKKEAVRATVNPALCRITEDFVFTHPFDDNETNVYPPELPRAAVDRIQRQPAVRTAVGEMKYAFLTQAEALIHGDLHSGSVMANTDETIVIDPEFSFYGPMGFDVGAMIANLLLSYVSQDWWRRAAGDDPRAAEDWLLATIVALWQGFERKFLVQWREHDAARGTSLIGRDLDGDSHQAFRHAFMRRLLADTLGFAACKMMRRIVGLAKVADIATIPDVATRTQAELRALRIAERLVVERRGFGSIEAVVDWARANGGQS